jgi:hypothetical protein
VIDQGFFALISATTSASVVDVTYVSRSTREAASGTSDSVVELGGDGYSRIAISRASVQLQFTEIGTDAHSADANLFRTRSRTSGAHSGKQSFPWRYVPWPSASNSSRITDAIAQQFSCSIYFGVRLMGRSSNLLVCREREYSLSSVCSPRIRLEWRPTSNPIYLDEKADPTSMRFLPLSSYSMLVIDPDHTTAQPEVALGQLLLTDCMRYLTRSFDFAFPSARINLSADICRSALLSMRMKYVETGAPDSDRCSIVRTT